MIGAKLLVRMPDSGQPNIEHLVAGAPLQSTESMRRDELHYVDLAQISGRRNLIAVSGRQGDDGTWSAEPASLQQRRFGAFSLAAIWATLVLSGPTVLLGFSLSSEGLSLSMEQMVIAVPIGAVVGGTILSLAAWAGAYNGVPTVLALRPAFGSSGRRCSG